MAKDIAALAPADKSALIAALFGAGLPEALGDRGLLTPLLSTGTDAASIDSNQAILSAALALGRRVTITKPGTYLYRGALRMVSRSTLDLGSGVTLKLADGSNTWGIRNQNWDAPTKAVTGTTGYTVVSSTEVYATLTVTGHGFTAADNPFLAVQGATNFGWNGVFRVKDYPDANTVRLWLWRVPPDANAAGSLTIAVADHNIAIVGKGTLNHNGPNNMGTTNADTFGHVMRNVYRPVVDGVHVSRGRKYAVDFSNCSAVQATNIDLDSDSDGVHFQGSIWGAYIHNITGKAFDDFVAFTGGDYAHGPASFYTLSVGDFDGIFIDGLFPLNCIYALKFTGNDQHRYGSVSAKNVAGIAHHGAIYGQPDLEQNSVYIDDLSCENISTHSMAPDSWPMINMDIAGSRKLTFRNVRCPHPNQNVIAIVGTGNNANATPAHDVINISEIYQPNAHQFAIVTIANAVTVNTINFDGNVNLAANGFGFHLSGTGTIGRINFLRGSFYGDLAGIPIRHNGAVKVNEINYEAGFKLRTVHSFYNQSNTAAQGSSPDIVIRFAGMLESMQNHAIIRSATAATGTKSVRIIYADAVMEGTHTNTIQILSTSVAPVSVEGSIHAGGSGNLPGRVVSNNAGTGALTVDGPTLRQAIDTVARKEGAMLYNTNAAANNGTDGAAALGVYIGVGTATGSYKKLGTAGGAGLQY